MKKNIDGEYYGSKSLDLYDFKWSTFITEEYNDDQKLIVIFMNDDEMIIKYSDLMDIPELQLHGIKKYLPVYWD